MSNKLKIAVTGGIGSGKSVLCNFLKEMNFPVINADKIAKDVLLNDSAVKQKIIDSFGKTSYTEKGINTRYLAENVFSDELKVRKINSIVHPPTIIQIKKTMTDLLKKNKFVFVEAALIFEAEMEELFDYIVLVSADEEIRIKRVIERDKVSEEDVRERMDNQLSEDIKKNLSDIVFENNGSIQDLKNKAQFLVTLLNSIVGAA